MQARFGAEFDPELYRKYNVAGPRYTSYPTVPYWEQSPTPSQWLDALRESLAEGKAKSVGASLYLHIPFCESLCTYCGCNKRITKNHAVARPYIDTLLKEWSLYRAGLGLGNSFPLADLHLGGGTPTFLNADELSYLLDALLETVTVQKGHDFAVEVDPRVTSRTQLEVMGRFGFNRISMGIQDFDPVVQNIVHRVQSEEQVASLTADARRIGFKSVNFDLIYGLPKQTPQSIEKTMAAVARLRPDRIAFYSYAHVPWIKPSQRRFTEQDLPVGDAKRKLYEIGRQLLQSEGYLEVGMDHFALPSDDLCLAVEEGRLHRNFMGYMSRHVSPVIGLGVSAIGDAWSCFAQNEKQLEVYTEKVLREELPVARGHVLTRSDLVIRKHILELMTGFETTWNSELLPEDVVSMFAQLPERLFELEKDKLLSLSQNRLQVTEKGRAFVRNICMALDERLLKKQPDSQLFSQTV